MENNNALNEITESEDDDSEIYFLKPVNDYNITEKIKAANEELFSQNDCCKLEIESSEKFSVLSNNRKVKFAQTLEQYEPQKMTMMMTTMTTTANLYFNDVELENTIETFDQKLEKVEEEEQENVDRLPEEKTEDVSKIDSERELHIIEAVCIKTIQEDYIENVIVEDKIAEIENTNSVISTIKDDFKEDISQNTEGNEVLQEICEDIYLMHIEENTPRFTPPSCMNQKKIIKQITFDYGCFDEGQESQAINNESLTNLLTLDNDEIEEEILEIHCNEEEKKTDNEIKDNEVEQSLLNCNEQLPCTEGNKEMKYEQEDDNDLISEVDNEDQLSIIVAAYIQDDYESSDKVSLNSNKCLLNQNSDNNNNNNNNNNSNNNIKSAVQHQQRKSKFSKCFSLHRKIKENGINDMKHRNEQTELKLRNKTCCEYKNFQKKLPKYTGYLSEYGLSHEQLMERERILQKKKLSLLQQTLKASEEELRKMQDNERAFVRWLKNKMRFPINKSRNMFDVKRPFGSKKLKRADFKIEKKTTKIIT